jgi:large repetitive protein
VAAGANALSIAVPSDAVPGTTYARFRLSTAGGLPFDGTAADGEVEDYVAHVLGHDFGDAPDSYRSLFASNGPRHADMGPMLGSTRDIESNAASPLKGIGDDLDPLGGPDDEDGVVLAPFTIGLSTTISVTAASAGKLDAFVDWNRDGDFADPGETVLSSAPVVAGVNALAIPVPASATLGPTYAAFDSAQRAGFPSMEPPTARHNPVVIPLAGCPESHARRK